MRFDRPTRVICALLASLALVAGCGGSDEPEQADRDPSTPVLGGGGDDGRSPGRPGGETARETPAAPAFPASATKNTTRVDSADPVAGAASVARAVFPARSRESRPAAVTLVDRGDWQTAISATQLMSRPIRAPMLLSQDGTLPAATAAALEFLAPTGAKAVGGAAVIRLGQARAPTGSRSRALAGKDAAERARAIDQLQTAATGKPSPAVVIAQGDAPDMAMPAAGWAAKSGTPVLWLRGEEIPDATRAAIRDHGRPKIYLLGPESVIAPSVARDLRRLGRVRRIAGPDAVRTAISFARYSDPGFGWNVVDPGHGFVFARASDPLFAAGAAPLSASGTYGPLLLLANGRELDKPVEEYLLDVQPGYDADPVRGVYNHGWIVGDEASITVDVQARVDALLEIAPVDPNRTTP